jgi:hypothetical protein
MNKLLIFIFACALQIAGAQELIRFPSGPASWTVECQRKGGQSVTGPVDNGPIVQKIEISQTDTARRSILHWSTGKKQELWSLPKMNILVAEDPLGKAFVTKNALMFGDPFSPADFGWITRDSRVGDEPVKMGGVECYHYKGMIVLPSHPSENRPITIPCEAWVNAETSLPVALLKGDILGKFTFGAPPESLEMPEKFLKRLNYHKMTMGMR